jgi:hypothetical protein
MIVMPVVKINEKDIADDKPGPHTLKLCELCIGAAIKPAAKTQAKRPKQSVKGSLPFSGKILW